MADERELKESNLNQVVGGGTWINGVEYKNGFKVFWARCPNCQCSGNIVLYTNEMDPDRCKKDAFVCGFCKTVWECNND